MSLSDLMEMAGFTIRRYEARDYVAVREIFAAGMSEHVPAACVHMLSQTWARLVLLTVFVGLLVSSQSLLLALLALTLILAAGQQIVTFSWSRYIKETINTDLLDIEQSYMARADSCFWVAECQGLVVGTVGARPSEQCRQDLELKRLSVRRDFRQRGIAKALCHTVIGLARARGLQAVVLGTSMLQVEAQKLYEKLGFQLQREVIIPQLLGKLTNFRISMYRFRIAS
uniref:probable N-acetyltransferase camello isoform X1 n=2 Tax=Pristiophorus japonicus TaxID=55135 RepID=UPI00398ED351